jgi:predicted membrane protein
MSRLVVAQLFFLVSTAVRCNAQRCSYASLFIILYNYITLVVMVCVHLIYVINSCSKTAPKAKTRDVSHQYSMPSFGVEVKRLSHVADLRYVKDPCDLRGSRNRRPN